MRFRARALSEHSQRVSPAATPEGGSSAQGSRVHSEAPSEAVSDAEDDGAGSEGSGAGAAAAAALQALVGSEAEPCFASSSRTAAVSDEDDGDFVPTSFGFGGGKAASRKRLGRSGKKA